MSRELFITKDLNHATVLYAYDMQPHCVTRHGLIKSFCFRDREVCEELIGAYLNRELLPIQPLDLDEARMSITNLR